MRKSEQSTSLWGAGQVVRTDKAPVVLVVVEAVDMVGVVMVVVVMGVVVFLFFF